jgi:hypothetical protein
MEREDIIINYASAHIESAMYALEKSKLPISKEVMAILKTCLASLPEIPTSIVLNHPTSIEHAYSSIDKKQSYLGECQNNSTSKGYHKNNDCK